MRLVAVAALQIFSLGMGGEGFGGIDLVLVARAAQLRLRPAQDGRVFRAVGKMAKVAFALSDAGVRLVDWMAVLFVTVTAKLCDRFDQQLGIGPCVRNMAVQAVALAERFVFEGDWNCRIRDILPVALTAHLRHRSPQSLWILSIQIVARPTRPIAKRWMHDLQTGHGRRPQAHVGGAGRGCGRNEGRWRGLRRGCGRG